MTHQHAVEVAILVRDFEDVHTAWAPLRTRGGAFLELERSINLRWQKKLEQKFVIRRRKKGCLLEGQLFSLAGRSTLRELNNEDFF